MKENQDGSKNELKDKNEPITEPGGGMGGTDRHAPGATHIDNGKNES